MVKAKRIIVNAKTGKEKIEEFDCTEPKVEPEPESINLEEVKKLLKYAKAQKWI